MLISRSPSLHNLRSDAAINSGKFLRRRRIAHVSKLGGACGPIGRRLNGFLGLSLNDRTILFLVILWDKTAVSVR